MKNLKATIASLSALAMTMPAAWGQSVPTAAMSFKPDNEFKRNADATLLCIGSVGATIFKPRADKKKDKAGLLDMEKRSVECMQVRELTVAELEKKSKTGLSFVPSELRNSSTPLGKNQTFIVYDFDRERFTLIDSNPKSACVQEFDWDLEGAPQAMGVSIWRDGRGAAFYESRDRMSDSLLASTCPHLEMTARMVTKQGYQEELKRRLRNLLNDAMPT